MPALLTMVPPVVPPVVPSVVTVLAMVAVVAVVAVVVVWWPDVVAAVEGRLLEPLRLSFCDDPSRAASPCATRPSSPDGGLSSPLVPPIPPVFLAPLPLLVGPLVSLPGC